MVTRGSWGVAAAALVAVMLAAGCGNDGGGGDGASEPLTKVTIVTGFKDRGHEAYIELAKAKGFDRAAGLDLQIQQGQGTDSNIKILLTGKADAVIVDITGALAAYGGKAPARPPVRGFTVVSALHQQSLSAIATVEGYGISGSNPRDLNGKRIGYTPGGVNKILFDAYAKLAGITRVEWKELRPELLMSALAAHEIDACVQVVVGGPQVQAATRREPVIFPYSTYLGDLYGNGLAVTTKTAKERPDLVRRLNNVLVGALDYAVTHPQEANDAFVNTHRTYKSAGQETLLLQPYVHPPSGPNSTEAAMGSIDESRIAKSIALLDATGLIDSSFLPAEVVSLNLTPTSPPPGPPAGRSNR